MIRNLVSSKEIILLLFITLTCAFSFTIKHGHILDDQNRQIYFHGMNIAVKVPPYLPKTDAYDENMSFAK